MLTSVEDRILSLYRRVREQAVEWAERVPLIADAGYRILCGPPIVGGPMVVSLNPGLTENIREHDRNDFWPERWPERMYYLRGVSYFARRLAEVFNGAGISLDSVNSAYALMFRSCDIKQWETTVPADVRACAEDLSLEILTEINRILKPKLIYAAGFDTFERMGCSPERLQHGLRKSGNKFDLLRFGDFGGVPVIASWHLSARLSRENLDQISAALSRFYARIA